MLTKSFPSASSNIHGEMAACAWPCPPLPGSRPAAESSILELDVLSIAASDSLTTEEQDDFTPMEEAASWQSQYSYSDESSGLHAAGSSAVFSLQETIKMAPAKLNMDLPFAGSFEPPAASSCSALGFPDTQLS